VKFGSISKRKREAIEEAVGVWTSTHTNTSDGRERFAKKLEKLGWERLCTNAAFKNCYSKGSIIVKFAWSPNNREQINEINREIQQWYQAPRKFRKHLPKIHVHLDGMIVQDRVMKYCHSGTCCAKAKKVANKFDYLEDWGHNHGHSLKGTTKFFDWVFRRSWDKVEDPEMDFLE